MKTIRALLFSLLVFISSPLLATVGMAKANGIDIWYETFGKKQDPAVLLVMGGFCQGIMWPTEFCEALAQEGFYVIRYDHRDAGLSTCFDFQNNPYDLTDMAKDGLGLLDSLGVSQANLVGLSMGGPIAELMAIHAPKRVSTLTLIATSSDFTPMSLAFAHSFREELSLSRPTDLYLGWMNQFLESPPKTEDEMVKLRVKGWSILSGNVVPFDEEGNAKLQRQFLSRAKHPETMGNHLLAINKSLFLVQTAPGQVTVPTLIFHGSEDQIFPPDHGPALAKAIAGSTFVPVEGFGHVPNQHFYNLFITKIKQHTKRS